ncbi:H-2 class II histocompatibility antigen, E-D alpha chain [Larimichthys crocea]|uniref:H-2 class II histocompatibility antigen, E-D alpha chain n=1 Tax=Larimichthys crocea TaxID=215358 RepID=A0A6G0IB85_LARCR|nr:H-2 class II histocompatibility antigen, E-D alpha chain [Larimichthys crocea]
MKCSAIILLLNIFSAFSQFPHDITYMVGCFENGTTEIQYQFDSEEVLHVDFKRQTVVFSLPRIITAQAEKIFADMHVYRNALKAKRVCAAFEAFLKAEKMHPAEEKDMPRSVLYPAEEIQLGVKNKLICLVNNFYPPDINVSWTRNDRPVSEGVSLSRYYPNNDQTFRQFASLTFTPREGDIYSCTVEHSALDRPITRIWDHELSQKSLGPDIFCGVGLTLGLLGVAAGTFLMVKGCHGQ